MFLNNRYHDPTLGHFISVDPLVAMTGQPYLYGDGNPATLSDPSGLCAADAYGGREKCVEARKTPPGQCGLPNSPPPCAGPTTTAKPAWTPPLGWELDPGDNPTVISNAGVADPVWQHLGDRVVGSNDGDGSFTFHGLELGRQYIVVVFATNFSGTFGVRVEQGIGGATQLPVFAGFVFTPTYPEASAVFFDAPKVCQLCEDRTAMDNYWDDYIPAIGWDPYIESPPPVNNQANVQSISASLANGTESTFVVRVYVNIGGAAEGWSHPENVTADWVPK